MPKTLIRGAHVLTMDDALGTIAGGDVLIDGDRIAAVGTGLDAAGADVVDGAERIVLPGFVDTHRHMWAAMLRGCACYGDLGTYFHDVVFTYGAELHARGHLRVDQVRPRRGDRLRDHDDARVGAQPADA